MRAAGFKEITTPFTAVQRGEIKLRLVRTTDEAELTFQQAETAREAAKDDESRQKAVDLYRRTVQLRTAFRSPRTTISTSRSSRRTRTFPS